jgi:hypothetical protein
MKPLSGLRKALVIGPFLLGLISLVYGYFSGDGLILRAGGVLFIAFMVLYALFIVPYWNSEPGVNPEMV